MGTIDYKAKLAEALRGGMRYCFPMMGMDGRTTFPELVESEFTGEDGEGFLHFIQSILFNARRHAFRNGYENGYLAALGDAATEDSKLTAKEWAEDAFITYDHD